MLGFQMLPQHLSAVTNRKISSLFLPGPNLRFGRPTGILIQLVVGFHIGAVNHVQVTDVQSPLFKNIKHLQAAPSGVPSRYTEIQAVPIRLAFLLGTVEQTFQSVKEQGEQRSSGKPGDPVRPAVKECNVTKVMVGNLMSHHECNLLIRGAKLVEAA